MVARGRSCDLSTSLCNKRLKILRINRVPLLEIVSQARPELELSARRPQTPRGQLLLKIRDAQRLDICCRQTHGPKFARVADQNADAPNDMNLAVPVRPERYNSNMRATILEL